MATRMLFKSPEAASHSYKVSAISATGSSSNGGALGDGVLLIKRQTFEKAVIL